MAVRKGCCVGGCLVKTLIAIVIIVVLIVGAFLWFINQTPKSLGFDDFEINGITIEEMGLADTKIKAIFKVVRGLYKVDVSKIVDNPFDPVADKSSAEEDLNSIGVPSEGDEIDYLYIMENVIVTDNPQLIELKDTEIAYLLNAIGQQGIESGEGKEEVEVIEQLNAAFVQVTIEKGEEIKVKIMLKIDISSIKDDIPNGIPFVGNIIPDEIYLNSINKLTVNEEGIISTQSDSIVINGMTDALTMNIVNALFANIVKEQTEEDPVVYLNDTFGELFRIVINNLGLVGEADTDNTGDVIESTINYGEEGVLNHKVYVITRTEAPEDETEE